MTQILLIFYKTSLFPEVFTRLVSPFPPEVDLLEVVATFQDNPGFRLALRHGLVQKVDLLFQLYDIHPVQRVGGERRVVRVGVVIDVDVVGSVRVQESRQVRADELGWTFERRQRRAFDAMERRRRDDFLGRKFASTFLLRRRRRLQAGVDGNQELLVV